jgi:hypothetical protein
MGEAKRRRMRLGQPIEFMDVNTNEMKTARNAGDPVEFLARLIASMAAEDRGERPVANVPCDGCTACCYFHEVDFDPKAERASDLPFLDFVVGDDGKAVLRKREDGACVHLGDSGCTVYEHRPRPCRHYDCRGVALVSMVDTFDGDRHSPFWIFDPQTKKGGLLKEAFKILGMMRQGQAAASGESLTAADTFGFALQHAVKLSSALEELSKLSPDEFAKATGVDPRTMTEEKYADAMRQMTAGKKTLPSPK